MAKSKPSRGKDKPRSKPLKSFSELKGSRSDVFKGVTGEQLGHDKQIPGINAMGKTSPLINPNEPGHPMELSRLGQAMGDEPRGPEFY